MKAYSKTHYLLLKQLGIVPLAAKAELFLSHELAETPSDLSPATYLPVENASTLTSDIWFALQQTSLTGWCSAEQIQTCSVEAQQLLTPESTLLQDSVLKRQLWQLLSEYGHD